MTTPYVLGETKAESHRLKAQLESDPIDARVIWAGLRPGHRVADAGCGPGETSRILARLVGPTGSVDGFDLSDERLGEATRAGPVEGGAPLTFRRGDVLAPPLEPGTYDFVFSQFVLEYLPRPQDAVQALARLLRPGGTLCLVDADVVGGTNWPEPEAVVRGTPRLVALMATTGFDTQVGRKLFSFVHAAGLAEADARLDPLLFAGAAPAWEVANWTQRFAALAPYGERAFGSREEYDGFVHAYLSMLGDPCSLKYTSIITVRGRKR